MTPAVADECQGKQSRSVLVFTDNNEELTLPLNIALQQPAFQKNNADWNGGGIAIRAVDGWEIFHAPENNNDHCSHTDNLPQPWWAVDLFEAKNIAFVKITNVKVPRKFPQYILYKYYLASEKVI